MISDEMIWYEMIWYIYMYIYIYVFIYLFIYLFIFLHISYHIISYHICIYIYMFNSHRHGDFRVVKLALGLTIDNGTWNWIVTITIFDCEMKHLASTSQCTWHWHQMFKSNEGKENIKSSAFWRHLMLMVIFAKEKFWRHGDLLEIYRYKEHSL